MSVKIIVGSTCDVEENIKKDLIVVPLHVTFGDEDFLDSVDITKDEFYERLERKKEFPKTSQPTPMAFMDTYKKVIDNGDEAVVIVISSKLSGTYQSAKLAANGLNDKIFIVDSLNVSIAEGALVDFAIRLVKEGKSAKEIAEILEEAKNKLRLVVLVDTLEYLERGGRISKTSAFIGGLFSVKVLLSMEEGAIATVGKAKGVKNANNLFISEIEKNGSIDFSMPLKLGYTGRESNKIEKYLREVKNLWEDKVHSSEFIQVGSVVGTHAGPGALFLAYFRN